MASVLVFFIIFSLLVLVHELGHFFMAKKSGIRIEEFGLGYPPRIASLKFNQTLYSLNLLPFGGFVKLYGEEGEVKPGKSTRGAFFTKSKKKRVVVLLSGVLANFLLGIICFSLIYNQLGIPQETNKVFIAGIAKDSPAEMVGLKPDDQILWIDEEEIGSMEQFQKRVQEKKGEEILLKVKRKNQPEELEFNLVPRIAPPEGEGAIGVALTNIEFVFYPAWQMPLRAVYTGLQEAVAWGGMVVLGLFSIIKNLIAGQVPEDIAGPIGIYQLTTGVAQQGLLMTTQFIGVLSVNLAILNVLPIPALDGGRILFVFLEKMIGRKVKPKVEQITHMVGMALLLFLMLVVTINDLARFQPVSEFFQKISSLF